MLDVSPRPRLLILGAVAATVLALASGSIVGTANIVDDIPRLASTDVAGFTKVGFTDEFLVVVNVLPGERIYSPDEFANEYPTVGEVAINGGGNALEIGSRHIEAHIYSRATGLAVKSPVPRLELTRHDTNETISIEPVLMQDVTIGPGDVHFGDNVQLPIGIGVTVRIFLGHSQEVVIDAILK